MISVDGLKVEFSVKPLFEDVSFVINDRDRIALVGKNGAGKSTMLKILCGQEKPTAGTVSVPNDTTIGYLPQVMKLTDDTTVREETRKAFASVSKLKQRVDELQSQLSVREDYDSEDYLNLVQSFTNAHDRYMMAEPDSMEANMERTLTGLGFSRQDFDRPTREFSGGWRMRIELAKILLESPDVLLLDEPTNHLDMHSKDVLLEALKSFGGTVVFVSHDRGFIEELSTKVLELHPGVFREFVGDYKYYMQRIEEEQSAEGEKNSVPEAKRSEQKTESKLSWEEQKKRESEKRKIQKEADKLEAMILESEEKKSELENQLSLPEVYSNG